MNNLNVNKSYKHKISIRNTFPNLKREQSEGRLQLVKYKQMEILWEPDV